MSAQKMIEDLEAFSAGYLSNPAQVDNDTRIRLAQACNKAFHAFEDGYDMSRRVLLEQPSEQLACRLGCDLKIFETLAAANKPLTLEQVNGKIKIEPSLLARILQAQTAFGFLKQTSEGYSLPPSATYFAQPDFAQCFGTLQDWMLPVYMNMPKKLAQEEYRLPQTDPLHTGVSFAYGQDGKGLFQILGERPNVAMAFAQLMNSWGSKGSLLYDYYPVQERLVEGFDPSVSNVMFVDVGGGWGHKAIAVKERYPHMPGRFIVQDLPDRIDSAPKTDMVELTVHDFFTPQPVRNPRCFYMRQTLHDWSDEDCLKILQELEPAMKPGYTKLLLHEQVVPAQNPGPWVVTQDFTMMQQLAAHERTEEQWRKVVEQAGLSITHVYLATDGVSESVIEVERQ